MRKKSKISGGGGNPPCCECPRRYIYVTLVAPMAGWMKEGEGGGDAVNRKRIVYEISDVLDFVCFPCQESDDLQAWEGKNIMMKRHNRHNFCIQECLIGKKLKKLGDKLKEIEKEKRKGEQDGTKKIV